jgi:hypothetical protein
MDAFDAAVRRYGAGQFNDDDVAYGTGLSERSWRELIKSGAVATITERLGRGYVRLCDHTVFKRAAVIAALNRSGLSLAVSGQIAYSLPFHSLLYEITDPWMILYGRAPVLDSQALLPPPIKKPVVDWFAPNRPAEADRENDWTVAIYDGRFVGVQYSAKEKPIVFGDLRRDGASFVTWWPLPQRVPRMGSVVDAFVRRHPQIFAAVAAWENPSKWAKELRALRYRLERHDGDQDALRIVADASIRSPLFMTTINVTLAIRKALRRYLGIEPGPSPSVSAPK